MASSTTSIENIQIDNAEKVPPRLWPHIHRTVVCYITMYRLKTRNYDAMVSIRAELRRDTNKNWTDLSMVFVTSCATNGPRKGTRRTFEMEVGGWSDELDEASAV